jgi:hypothetical protein
MILINNTTISFSVLSFMKNIYITLNFIDIFLESFSALETLRGY